MPNRLEAMISAAPGSTRAERVHATGLRLRETSAYVRILLCELTYEVCVAKHWKSLVQPDGRPYPTSLSYLRILWGTHYSWAAISARKRLGLAIASFPDTQREWLHDRLAEVGMTRSLALALAIQCVKEAEPMGTWLSRAADPRVDAEHLRRWVRRAFAPERHNNGTQTTQNVCPHCRRPWRVSAAKGALYSQTTTGAKT